MLSFLDTQKVANTGQLAFAILEDDTLIYGVIRDIKHEKAILGYEGNYKYASQIYEHYPDCCCVFIPSKLNRKNAISQLSLFS